MMNDKKKILIIHRNNVIQERIARYLKEVGFSAIVAPNIQEVSNLTRSMKPDLILWGTSLTAPSKNVIRQIKSSREGALIPIVVMIPDVELFERLEIKKLGIDDTVDLTPNFSELKIKIMIHLQQRDRILNYERKMWDLQKIVELQHSMLRTHDLVHLSEAVNDFIHSVIQPDYLIHFLYDAKKKEYEFSSVISKNRIRTRAKDEILNIPFWKQYFFNNPKLTPQKLTDSYILNFLKTIGLDGKSFYQFPIRINPQILGIILLGFKKEVDLTRDRFNELLFVTHSFENRTIELLKTPSQAERPDETTEIRYLFKRMNEDKIAKHLNQQLLEQLKGDVSVYFNFHEGFRFLYPQYFFQTNGENNLFEKEKPPVLLLKDYPTLEKFLESDVSSLIVNFSQDEASDIRRIMDLSGKQYKVGVLFNIRIGNEKKGLMVVASEKSDRIFSPDQIMEAEHLIANATAILEESRVVKQAQKTLKQLDRIFELGKELTLENDIGELLDKIATAIRRTLGWNIVILDRIDPYTGSVKNVRYYGITTAVYKKLKIKYKDSFFTSLADKSFKISQSYFYDNVLSKERITPEDHLQFQLSLGREWSDEDWLIIPIRSRGRELGYIAVNDPVDRVRPSEEKVRSLEYFANQAAVVLENAKLYQDLKNSEEKYRLLAETMTLGLVTCDFKGNIIYINQSLISLLKYKDRDMLLNHSFYELCSLKTRTEFENQILKLSKKDISPKELEKLSRQGLEIELMSNENEYIPFMIYLTPYYENVKKAGFIGVLSDLRPQRRLEQLKTDFNSMIVHDLRSPLNIIQGYIDIVRNQVVGNVTEEQAELLTIAKENVDKVLKLIDNFMIASKLEAGRFELNIEIHSINALIETVFKHHQVLARKKNIKMELDLDDNISFLQFDRLRIEQVLNNYLSNAIKFTDSGGKIKITSRLVKEKNELTGEEIMAVHVSVADTGIGIPFKEQEKVFSKYEQTEAGKDASLKGTGLGLAISKEIITLHNGRVWLKSEPGKGSTFYFSLPIIPIKI
ncbi:MAG: PAS domain-containing protein [Calditrichaeota bacterium]|nr:PAS domain-containing protein [Calditrichota bacterium]